MKLFIWSMKVSDSNFAISKRTQNNNQNQQRNEKDFFTHARPHGDTPPCSSTGLIHRAL